MKTISERDQAALWHPFTQHKTAPIPIEIVSGEKEYLFTRDGEKLVDLISSWWVNLHGHAHPHIAEAIAHQAQTLEHVIFAGFTHEPAVRLAEALVAATPQGLDRVFFSDNGSTSVEVALKMALQYWQQMGHPERQRIVAFRNGYHGDTVGGMSVGLSSGFYDSFRRILFPVEFVAYPETFCGDPNVAEREEETLAELRTLLFAGEESGTVAAILIEPLVQGAAGMRMCRPEFVVQLRRLATEAGTLLIFDEVMTGFGRTGAMFASIRAGVSPDLLCLSKGITGGFMPLAATLATNQLYEAFLGDSFDSAFVHGHSYTANPLACAAALASLELFAQERTLERVAELEALFMEQAVCFGTAAHFCRPRVTGAIFAIDLCVNDPGYTSTIGATLRSHFAANGFLVRPLGNTLYFMPPYCIGRENMEQAFLVLERFQTNH
jgi:adenosylmethionine-8-amino-7-oxononanoate aminotransferase